jgi:hypothetical protein
VAIDAPERPSRLAADLSVLSQKQIMRTFFPLMSKRALTITAA